MSSLESQPEKVNLLRSVSPDLFRNLENLTRKQRLKLLIIDEVHLLNEERGAVIETIVARTLRQVESSQSVIRIVGLSATLPNYLDVAEFLRLTFFYPIAEFQADGILVYPVIPDCFISIHHSGPFHSNSILSESEGSPEAPNLVRIWIASHSKRYPN